MVYTVVGRAILPAYVLEQARRLVRPKDAAFLVCYVLRDAAEMDGDPFRVVAPETPRAYPGTNVRVRDRLSHCRRVDGYYVHPNHFKPLLERARR